MQTARKRGRPLKFGRPTRLVTLSIPEDVYAWLRSVDADPARAVVKLCERATKTGKTRLNHVADLVQIPGGRALILVQPEPFRNLKGISIIPLADGRGFLALDSGKGVADLELEVIDRLESQSLPAAEHEALQFLRCQLREWRDNGTEFESRSIVIARRPSTIGRGRVLSPISRSRDPGDS